MRYYRHESMTWGDLGIYVGVIGGAMLLGSGCGSFISEATYSAGDAETYVEDSGYTDVEYLDTDRFFIQMTGCGRDDLIKYEFEATAPATERKVQIDVCDSPFKGATIRQG